MKKQSFTLFLGVIISGLFAASLATAQTSPGTKIIYSTSKYNNAGYSSDDYVRKDEGIPANAHQKCLNWVRDIHAEWTLQSGGAALETECSVITPKVTVTSRVFRYTKFTCFIGCRDTDDGPGVVYTVRYEVACQRRPLGESQAMHQFHLCKTNPSAQCVSPEYLNYINSVALTQYNDVDASACNQLSSGSSYSPKPYNNNSDNFGFR